MDFLPVPFGSHFKTFSVINLEKRFRIVCFFGAVSRAVLFRFLLSFGCVFQTFVEVVGEGWIQ